MGLCSCLPSSNETGLASWCSWHWERKFSRFVPPRKRDQRSDSWFPVLKARRWSTQLAGLSHPSVSHMGLRPSFIARTPLGPFQICLEYHLCGLFITSPLVVV